MHEGTCSKKEELPSLAKIIYRYSLLESDRMIHDRDNIIFETVLRFFPINKIYQ